MEFYMRKQFSIAIIIYLGPMLVGYSLGWSAPMEPLLQNAETTPTAEPLSPAQTNLVGSVIYVGSIIGPYAASYFSNEYGRKPCLIMGGVVTFLSYLILALARNLAMLLAGRILCGLGVGILFVISLVYLGEIASTRIRGILLTGTGITSTIATLTVYSVGAFAPYAVASYVAVVISTVYVIGLFFVPETPAFYAMKAREEEAKKVLIDVGRGDEIDTEIATKKEKTEEDNSNWKDLFIIKSNRKAFIINITLGILQSLSGVVVITFFAVTIFDMAGSSLDATLSAIVLAGGQVFSGCLAPLFVEKAGRKLLLMLSTGICGLSMAILATYFFLHETQEHIDAVGKAGWLPIATLITFFVAYDLGFNTIPGALMSELFDSKVRSLGSSIMMTTSWLVGFALASSFSTLIELIGSYSNFLLFSAACFAACAFTAICVPETMGRSLLDIQVMLNN